MSTIFEFNRVTFGLPVETFRVEANIALEKRLPVVKEFVLRLLRVTGPISLHAFRDFFGFSNSEALSVLESLSSEGFVELVDDLVQLSASATDKFDKAGGELPSFTKVELKTDTVTFDLVHFFPLRAASLAPHQDNLLKLEAPDEAISESVKRARQAYRDRYPEIASSRTDLRERSYGVYSVEDIESKRRGYAPIPVSFSLDINGQVQRTIGGDFERLAPTDLVNFVNERISAEIPSTLSIINVDEFLGTFELPALNQYLTGRKFDVLRYIADVHVSKSVELPKDVEPILGNLYLPENRDKINGRIAAARSGKRKGPGALLSSLVWLAPDYALWGRGEDFSQAITLFSETLKAEGQGDGIALCAYSEAGQDQQVTTALLVSKLREIHFSRPLPPDGRLMGGRLELMLYPCSFMAAVFHLPAPGEPGLWLPVGFISRQSKHLELAQKLLRTAMSGNRYAARGKGGKAAGARAQSFEEGLPFLNYCPIS